MLISGDAIKIYRATAKIEVKRQHSNYGCVLVSLVHKVYTSLHCIKRITCNCYPKELFLYEQDQLI